MTRTILLALCLATVAGVSVERIEATRLDVRAAVADHPQVRSADAQAPDTSVRAVVAAATRYVEDYQKQFAFLVADETYRQSRFDPSGLEMQRRTMTGELFLTYFAADEEWMAVHDIAEVDGRPVPDRENLRELLLRGDEIRGLAGRIANRNARFNIGTVERNFNEPTLALLVVGSKRVDTFSFSRRTVRREGTATLVTLGFEERRGPTLVRGPDGPVRARGELTVDATTGAIRYTRFELRQGSVRAELVTTYTHDERLELWVPATFTERYEGTREGKREVVTCEATYANYRRFMGSGRIKGSMVRGFGSSMVRGFEGASGRGR